ncbi:hypothetical protein QE152_g25128 [Popillia japonica]|uniref:Uncharacterized protein n=1 Tax=Popillia japonica TaxID=7064 RepID=A0AAW1K277_POPJA
MPTILKLNCANFETELQIILVRQFSSRVVGNDVFKDKFFNDVSVTSSCNGNGHILVTGSLITPLMVLNVTTRLIPSVPG